MYLQILNFHKNDFLFLNTNRSKQAKTKEYFRLKLQLAKHEANTRRVTKVSTI